MDFGLYSAKKGTPRVFLSDKILQPVFIRRRCVSWKPCPHCRRIRRQIAVSGDYLLLSGELLAKRCRTDDLMPSIPVLCLHPSRVDPKVLGWASSSITINQVDLGRPGGLRQSGGGRNAAAMTRWWSSSGADRARCPKNLNRQCGQGLSMLHTRRRRSLENKFYTNILWLCRDSTFLSRYSVGYVHAECWQNMQMTMLINMQQ